MLDILSGKELYEKVDKLRKERGWTIYKLAKNAAVAPTTIYNWRDRESSPSLALLEAICSAFGVNVIDFILNNDEPIALTKDQKELIDLWNTLSDKQKKLVINFIKSLQSI